MPAYRGRREFRATKGMFLMSILAGLVFAAGAVMTYRLHGWNWVSVVLTGGSVLGLAGVFEALAMRVLLTDDAMLVTDYRGRRRYPISDITGVEEAKGSPTFILLRNGSAVKLPPVGTSLGNSVRAWLRDPAGMKGRSGKQPADASRADGSEL